ncbi:hypothetical protein D3C79_682400 [compost metagenome]
MADVEGVAAGDGDLLGHGYPPGLALQQGTDRHVVVGAEQAVQIGVAGHGLLQQLATQGEAGGLLGQQVLAIQAEVRHRLVVALHPQLGTHIEARPQVDHLAPSPAQHLCYHGPGGGPVIHADHHVDGGERQIHGLHHRDAGGGDHLAGAIRVLGVGEDEAIHVVGEQGGDLLLLPLRAVAIVGQKSLVAGGPGHRLYAVDHRREDLVGEGGDQDADRLAGGIGEHVRCPVRDVAEFLHRRGDSLTGAFGHGGRVTQVAADGHLGDPGQVGDVLQCGAALAGVVHLGIRQRMLQVTLPFLRKKVSI